MTLPRAGRTPPAPDDRAGARLAEHMGIATSRTTLLRRVMERPDPPATMPQAVGIDDFALRRGHVYGTVVIDAESHRVLAPSGTLKRWCRGWPDTRRSR
jgi:transposase